MIRVARFDEFDETGLAKLRRLLYTSFGVGCEDAGKVDLPSGLSEPLDAVQLLERAPQVTSFADDRVLYLTAGKLKDRTLPTGTVPLMGYALPPMRRALVSTAGMKGTLEDSLRSVGRQALHQLGTLWQLHHCLDPRCSMYPPWTPSYVQGEAIFCPFCREKSEQKIRLAKS